MAPPSADELLRQWLAAGVANALTSALLNPVDVAKTRMQTAPPPPASLLATLRAMRAEGGGVLRGLFLPGLGATMAREMLSSGCRAGFYTPVRDAIARLVGDAGGGRGGGGGGGAKGEHPAPKIAASMLTGVVGSLVANPVDVVKIRLFNEPARYSGLLSGLAAVHAREGLAGLYRGLAPSTLRAAFIAAGELGTYDVAKTALRNAAFAAGGGGGSGAVAAVTGGSAAGGGAGGTGGAGRAEESVLLHVGASLITGVVAAFVAAPFDLIKARAMAGSGVPLTIAAALRQLRAEPSFPLNLFRGVVPAYLRLGPHALICFPLFEQLRLAVGLESL